MWRCSSTLIALVVLLLFREVVCLSCSSSIVMSSPTRTRRRRNLGPSMALVRLEPQPDEAAMMPLMGPDCRCVVASSVVGDKVPVRSPSGFIECCVEVGLTTVGSLMSGGILGYIIGVGMGAFQKGNWSSGFPGVIKAMNTKGIQTGSSWGTITACFAGFGAAARVIRAKDDKWNQVLGSCGAGAVMCRDKGPSGMLQGCVSYGVFSYFIDMLGGTPPSQQSSTPSGDDLDFVDVPIEDKDTPAVNTNTRTNKSTDGTNSSSKRTRTPLSAAGNSSGSSRGREKLPLRVR